MIETSHLTQENRDLLLSREQFIKEIRFEPSLIWLLRPCRVRVLLVVDGLTFSADGFGLSTFVQTLLGTGGYVRFDITLADLNNPGAAAMLPGEPRIVERITRFKFDEPAHFTPEKFDVVFLFGIATAFFGRGQGYPSDSLADGELQVLGEFQNAGGGLFATGDHGELGRALGHKVARVRDMRLWASTSGQNDADEVSMGGARRNDTNRPGDNGSLFADQSDAVPQKISPTMYSRRGGIFRYQFPHPLLCGPKGVIRVMPDHPHEGQCKTPDDVDRPLSFTGDLGPEFPFATDGGLRPLPEIVSTNSVLAGTTSGGKAATVAHSFPGIAAYDGHRAGVGRCVTDATWHHFVNVNLIGDITEPVGDPKRLGFLATAPGQAHLEEIKAYYRNLAVWLAPPDKIRCMTSRLLWTVVYSDRVLEAVLSTQNVPLGDVHPSTLALIGRHARDVLGRHAGRCQSVRIILDLIRPIEVNRRLIPEIDPWLPIEQRQRLEDDHQLPVVEIEPLLDAALGAGLVQLNETFGSLDEGRLAELDSSLVLEVATQGADIGFKRAATSLHETLARASAMFESLRLGPTSGPAESS